MAYLERVALDDDVARERVAARAAGQGPVLGEGQRRVGVDQRDHVAVDDLGQLPGAHDGRAGGGHEDREVVAATVQQVQLARADVPAGDQAERRVPGALDLHPGFRAGHLGAAHGAEGQRIAGERGDTEPLVTARATTGLASVQPERDGDAVRDGDQLAVDEQESRLPVGALDGHARGRVGGEDEERGAVRIHQLEGAIHDGPARDGGERAQVLALEAHGGLLARHHRRADVAERDGVTLELHGAEPRVAAALAARLGAVDAQCRVHAGRHIDERNAAAGHLHEPPVDALGRHGRGRGLAGHGARQGGQKEARKQQASR